MPPRYPTNPHRLTLHLDPITSAALTQAAKAAKRNRDELVYGMIQQALGIGTTIAVPPSATPTYPELEDRIGEALARLPRR